MTISPAMLAKLAELREWAADPGALIYVFAPQDRPRFLLFKEQIEAHDTDDKLYAYLCARIAGKDGIDPA